MKMKEKNIDHGFAWVILAASFLNWMLVSGTIRTFGILYAELLKTFNEGAGNTAFVGSLTFFIMAITGPVAGFISVHYSFRLCTIAGGFFASLGMVTSSFAHSIEHLFFTYSCLIGIGIGLSSACTITIINFYFEKRRGFAVSLMTASMGLSSLTYPILYRTLIDTYGINGAMLVLGGILLNICVGGSLYRQPKCFTRKHESISIETEPNESVNQNQTSKAIHLSTIGQKVKDTLKLYASFLKNKYFIITTLALSFSLVGYSSNFVILPPHIESQGYSKSDVVLVLSVIGGTELLIRLFSGHLLDLNIFTVQTMFIVTMFFGGICAIVYTFFTNKVVNILYGVTVGIFPGNLHYLRPLLLVSILGLKSLPAALPLCSLVSNIIVLIGHPLMGWLEDWTGNWLASFYTVGSVLISSSVCVLIDRKLWKQEEQTVNDIPRVSNEEINIEIHPLKGETVEHKDDTEHETDTSAMLNNKT